MLETLNEVKTLNEAEVIPEGDHAAILLAARPALPFLPFIEEEPLRFAPGGTPAPPAIPAVMPGPRARHRPLSRLFDLAVVALMVVCAAVCAAVCAYRLFWAMRP